MVEFILGMDQNQLVAIVGVISYSIGYVSGYEVRGHLRPPTPTKKG